MERMKKKKTNRNQLKLECKTHGKKTFKFIIYIFSCVLSIFDVL